MADQHVTPRFCYTDNPIAWDEPKCLCPCGVPVADYCVGEAGYTTEPMVQCPTCGGKFVICQECRSTPVAKKTWTNKLHILGEKYLEYERTRKDKNYTWESEADRIANMKLQHYDHGAWGHGITELSTWTAPVQRQLMRITGICTDQIFGTVWPTNWTGQEIKDAFENGDNLDLPAYTGKWDGHKKNVRWLPVDCHDAEDNDVAGLDTGHDGRYVCLQCRCDACGHTTTMRYWGD